MNNSRMFFVGYLTGILALISVIAIDEITNTRTIVYAMIELLLVCVIYIIGRVIAEAVGKNG